MAIASTLTLLLAATGGSASPLLYTRPHVRATDGLNTRAVAAGKLFFGSATDNPELTDTAYVAGLNNTADFGQITPGNSQKWDTVEPSRGTFNFQKGDVIANLAKANGQKLRCHTLVWYSQLPSWVSNGGFDNATLIDVMKNHITKEVEHYKGQCYSWDVVNEALNEDGTYRDSVFYKTIGEAYIPIAFAAAAAADPDVKLYYNDYNIESSGSKSTAAQKIVKLVKSHGAKIDGVGLQSHFIVGSTPSQSAQTTNMQAFVDLGVEVAVTELDIRAKTPVSSSDLAQQAKDYASTVGACKAIKKCVGFTIWDYTDKYSWVPSVFSGYGGALPWDENLKKKESVYNAILAAWGSGNASISDDTTTISPSASVLSNTAALIVSATTSASITQTSEGAQPTISASSETVEKWSQCGGNGYSGATTCASGSTCTKMNDWYSQCV